MNSRKQSEISLNFFLTHRNRRVFAGFLQQVKIRPLAGDPHTWWRHKATTDEDDYLHADARKSKIHHIILHWCWEVAEQPDLFVYICILFIFEISFYLICIIIKLQTHMLHDNQLVDYDHFTKEEEAKKDSWTYRFFFIHTDIKTFIQTVSGLP